MPTLINSEVYQCLDEMATDLRNIIQSRAVPDDMLPHLRSVLATLMVAMLNTKPQYAEEGRS